MKNQAHFRKIPPDDGFAAVVFDFDGTLAELHLDFSAMRSAICSLLDRYGLNPQDYAHLYILEMIEAAASGLDAKDGLGKHFFREAMEKLAAMETEAAVETALFDGVRDLLGDLSLAGITTGIITRNCRAAVATVFPDYGDYIAALITREMTRYVKPDPRHLWEMLSCLDASPARSLMVGDHPIDIRVGRDVGTFTAAVTTGTGEMENLRLAGPDFLLSRVTEIRDIAIGARRKPL